VRANIERALRTEAFPSWNDAARVLLDQADPALSAVEGTG
jgi:hypothetical protein